jgi:conjugal transfer pilin signal peptidase TrbI
MTQENKKRLIIAGLCLLAGYFTAKIVERITITGNHSVKYTLFWHSAPDVAKIVHGQYVRLKAPVALPGYNCKPCNITKKVGCRAGDHLVNKGGRFFCNDKLICKALTGHEPFDFSGTIPDGKVFLIGDSQDSYDSRYFGFIEEGDIDAILRPIL